MNINTTVTSADKLKNISSTFICFVGTDGAGKTTLAKVFGAKQRETHQVAYQYIDAGVYYTYILGAMRKVLEKFRPGTDNTTESVCLGKAKKPTGIKRLRNTLYSIALLVDYAFTTSIKVTWPLRRGRNITSARYIYDIAIKIRLLFDLDDAQTHTIIRRFTAVFPTPDYLFLIDIPEEVAFARKDDITSITYLLDRRQLYYRIMQPYVSTVLDGCKPIDELITEVENCILEVA